MERINLKDDSIFLIEGFLTANECERLVQDAVVRGVTDAPITTSTGPVMRKDIRNNSRLMLDNAKLAATLFERARPCLVDEWLRRKVLGFNERF